MKTISELDRLKEKERNKEKIRKEHVDVKWVLTISILSFILSLLMSFFSQETIPNLPVLLGVFVTLFIIFIGILFDIVGVSVTASDEAIFHAMNSRRVRGAKVAVKLKKNAHKVSSFCCDVIGDICGIISGACVVTISLQLANSFHFNLLFTNLIIAAFVASLTIGGKAIGKSYAINKSDIILYYFAKIISVFYKE